MDKLSRIKAELEHVPALPGVYLWKDADGHVIYVGKAKQLRARMRQYVSFQDDRAKIPLLVEQIESFDYIVTETEHESLVLEKNLIKQHAPFFNADFKDDKSYPFIALTKGDVFPAIKYTREKHRPNTRYFGPYTDTRAARELVDIARKVVPLCSASCADWRRMTRLLEGLASQQNAPQSLAPQLQSPQPPESAQSLATPPSLSSAPHPLQPPQSPKSLTPQPPQSPQPPTPQPTAFQTKPCFDSHVGLGPGACCGKITPQEYAENVHRIERFLSGAHREFLDELRADMMEAAENLEFERAARIKARIDTIETI